MKDISALEEATDFRGRDVVTVGNRSYIYLRIAKCLGNCCEGEGILRLLNCFEKARGVEITKWEISQCLTQSATFVFSIKNEVYGIWITHLPIPK